MKYVGIKQVLKAAKSCEVTKVYIGKDAEEHVVQELILVCNENKKHQYLNGKQVL